MRRVAMAAILAIATVMGAQSPARAQSVAPPTNPLPPLTRAGPTPLAWYGIGSIACAAVSPMIGTLMLGRELTVTEVDRMALVLFPRTGRMAAGPGPVPGSWSSPQTRRRKIRRRAVRGKRAAATSIFRRAAMTASCRNEVLLEVESDTPAQYLNVVARRLQLTLLETQTFALTGRSL